MRMVRSLMLYLGTVSHRHGVDQCVRVLPLVREKIPGIKLLIHCKLSEGEGQPLQEWKDIAKEIGVENLLEIGASLRLVCSRRSP